MIREGDVVALRFLFAFYGGGKSGIRAVNTGRGGEAGKSGFLGSKKRRVHHTVRQAKMNRGAVREDKKTFIKGKSLSLIRGERGRDNKKTQNKNVLLR